MRPMHLRPHIPGCPRAFRRLTSPTPRTGAATVSNTFHGRDVFAPVAAHYSLGVAAPAMGEPVSDLVRLPSLQPVEHAGALAGEVVYVDGYGNLVTNIPAGRLPADAAVEIAGQRIAGLSRHYDAARPLVALVGSHDTLEVARPGGSAAEALGVGRGAPVRVMRR